MTSAFTEALALASRLHRKQVRKGPSAAPYLSHLLIVAGTVLEFGGTEEEAIAALLHDTVEDQGGEATRQLVRRLFGAAVAEIVDGCTDTMETPKPPWRERKERFTESLRAVGPSVLLVVLADKVSNMRSTIRDLRTDGAAIWNRFHGGRDGTLWYYRTISEAVDPPDGRIEALYAEYRSTLAELEAAAGV